MNQKTHAPCGTLPEPCIVGPRAADARPRADDAAGAAIAVRAGRLERGGLATRYDRLRAPSITRSYRIFERVRHIPNLHLACVGLHTRHYIPAQ